jgi:hypothetical protein
MPGKPIGQFGPATIVTDGATQVFDCSTGGIFQWTLGASRTMTAPVNMVPEQFMELRVVQDGTGSRLVTWPAVIVWSGGTAPTLTTTAGRMDIVSGTWDSVNSRWRMRSSVLNYVV